MSKPGFTTSFQVAESPEAVFKTIMNVRSWWSGLYGEDIEDGPEGSFTFRAGGGAHYSSQKLAGLVPNEKVVWLVDDSKLGFVSDGEEWTGTSFGFELQPEGEGTRITFTHTGLVPALECFEQCSSAWSRYMQERLLPLLSSKVPVC